MGGPPPGSHPTPGVRPACSAWAGGLLSAQLCSLSEFSVSPEEAECIGAHPRVLPSFRGHGSWDLPSLVCSVMSVSRLPVLSSFRSCFHWESSSRSLAPPLWPKQRRVMVVLNPCCRFPTVAPAVRTRLSQGHVCSFFLHALDIF